jgi:uncharacterized protein
MALSAGSAVRDDDLVIRRALAVLGLLGLWLGAPSTAFAAPDYPVPTSFVVDTAGVIPAPVERQIASELASFEDRTQHQMAVAVVPSLGGQSVDDYARGLFDRWGIGRAGVDDGALLLVGVKERRVRVQVGSGLTNTITNDAAVNIVNQITPTLRQNDFAAGVLAGERAMRSTTGDQQLEAQAAPRVPRFGGGRAVPADGGEQGQTNGWLVGVTLGLIGLVIAGLFFFVTRDIRRHPGGGSGSIGATGYVGGFSGGGFSGGGGGGGGGAVGGGGGASGGF